MTGERSSALGEALARCRSAFVGVGIFSCAVNLLMLTGPLFMLQIYDRVLASGSIPTLVALAVLMVALYGFMGLMELVRSRVLVRIGAKLDEELRGSVFRAMLGHGVGPRGEALSGARPLRDLETLRQFTAGPGPGTFCDLPWMPIYLAVVFMLHVWLGWFAVAAACLLLVLALLNELMTGRHLAKAAQIAEGAHALAEEGRRAADTARALGMEAALEARWLRLKDEARDAQGGASDRAGLFASLSKTLRPVFQSGMLAMGAWLAIMGKITPGTMIAASILMGRALAPVDQAIAHWRGFQSSRQAWTRLSELLSKRRLAPQRTQLPPPRGAVEVDGLTAWTIGPDGRPLERPVISGIRFQLEPGEGLGIIGPSGAGKTTLAKAVLGLWPHVKGEVRLDGATLDQWEPDALGAHLGYLPQEGALFPGTVAENIARFGQGAASEAIIAAAQTAGVHELILGLSEGYETRLGPNGRGLSAGQRQRIALARALYGDPCLIVLDEPNANLDAQGDAALTRAIESSRARGATVIVVAHRPSAIGAVDKVLMLRDGAQTAFGPKDEVLRAIAQSPAGKAAARAQKQRGTSRPIGIGDKAAGSGG